MRKIDAIKQISQQAENHWHSVLEALSINVHQDPNKHTSCPACGGKDRFRFDNQEGRGTYYCNQCGAGDGLSLVQKVRGCDASDAAKMVHDVLSGAPLPSVRPEQLLAREKATESVPIDKKVLGMMASAELGESVYMNNKGLYGYKLPILNDGKAVVTLVNIKGEMMGAQLLPPNGTEKKKLLGGSQKKGAFAVVWGMKKQPLSIVIAEGFATAVTVSKCHDNENSLTLAAMDAGNLKPVAIE
ncbi:primase-helicase zinc-binding domain-containing protein, partial [Xenorhabdus sp. Sc-CR9]|uniref:primase-helicase zinc-binding domain-containing protein n=1 Tax=Xenorhabdus sp. Sc-CR9 TaxID=2584468 RepID=UPI00235109F2